MSTLEQYIERFLRFGNMDKGFPLYQYDGGQCSYTIHISGIVHGNEVGSLPTLVHLIEDLESQNTYFGGQINITLGNLEAARLNRRFIDADLNRLFLKSQLLTRQRRCSHLLRRPLRSHYARPSR